MADRLWLIAYMLGRPIVVGASSQQVISAPFLQAGPDFREGLFELLPLADVDRQVLFERIRIVRRVADELHVVEELFQAFARIVGIFWIASGNQ